MSKRDIAIVLIALYFVVKGGLSFTQYFAQGDYEVAVRILDGVGAGMGIIICLWMFSVYRDD